MIFKGMEPSTAPVPEAATRRSPLLVLRLATAASNCCSLHTSTRSTLLSLELARGPATKMSTARVTLLETLAPAATALAAATERATLNLPVKQIVFPAIEDVEDVDKVDVGEEGTADEDASKGLIFAVFGRFFWLPLPSTSPRREFSASFPRYARRCLHVRLAMLPRTERKNTST